MSQNVNEQIIIEVVSKAIDSLGKNTAQVLWSILETDYGLTKDKIPQNLPALVIALQKTFGLGYCFIDLLFQTLLQQSTGQNLKSKNFIECVNELKTSKEFINKKEKTEKKKFDCSSNADKKEIV